MRLGLCSAVLMLSLAATLPAQAEMQEKGVAVLQGLDKVTARISRLRAPLDQPVTFGSLEIVARTCKKSPPEEAPEAAAFLEVRDVKPNVPAKNVFTGWMFASSPGVSAMEHPVYDIWVVDCASSDGGDAPDATPDPSGQSSE